MRTVLNPYSDVRGVHISETDSEFPFYNHITAKELVRIFDARGWRWSAYRSFCVVRNPFDRVPSVYRHLLKIGGLSPSVGFAGFVKKIAQGRNPLTRSLKELAFDESGRPLVTDILRFESLSVALPQFLRTIGVPSPVERAVEIPHLNASEGRRDHVYDDETRSIVARVYAYEIERFGYEPR